MGCDFTKFREERLEIKNELSMRSKALATEDFPSEELIKEFLIPKDNVAKLDVKWKQPDLVNFVVSVECKYIDMVVYWLKELSFRFLEICSQVFILGRDICF